MKRIGNKIYKLDYSPEFGGTCEWLLIGEVKMGIDGEYIQYYL